MIMDCFFVEFVIVFFWCVLVEILLGMFYVQIFLGYESWNLWIGEVVVVVFVFIMFYVFLDVFYVIVLGLCMGEIEEECCVNVFVEVDFVEFVVVECVEVMEVEVWEFVG